jgi:hypothetical protein
MRREPLQGHMPCKSLWRGRTLGSARLALFRFNLGDTQHFQTKRFLDKQHEVHLCLSLVHLENKLHPA